MTVTVFWIAVALAYAFIGYLVALEVFGRGWNEAPGSPWVCGAIWPLLVGTAFVQRCWATVTGRNDND